MAKQIAARVLSARPNLRPKDPPLSESEQAMLGMLAAAVAGEIVGVIAELRQQCGDLNETIVELVDRVRKLEANAGIKSPAGEQIGEAVDGPRTEVGRIPGPGRRSSSTRGPTDGG